MNEIIEAIVNSDNIPTPPGVALRLLELYNQEDVDASEISQVLGADPVLTAKLIAYSNSPILGRSIQTTSLKQAVVAAGMRATRIIGLSFSLMQSSGNKVAGFDFDEFWNQSLATAVAARTLSEHLRFEADEAFLMGLILNIGEMAIASTFPDEYVVMTRKAKEAGLPLVQLEQEKWSENRYPIGRLLLEKWNFPSNIAGTIGDYGDPQSEPCGVLDVLRLAEQISAMLFEKDLSIDQIQTAKSFAKSNLDIDEDTFEQLFDKIVPTWSEYAQLLEFDVANAVTILDLENQARHQIASFSLGMAAENAEIQRQNLDLKTKALVDGLTGLKNRRAYETEAAEKLDQSKLEQKLFVLMVIDIDHFKRINDTHGHAAGDAVLTEVGQVLHDDLRRKDSVFRIGGEEFVVILPDCNPRDAVSAAERLRSAIEETNIRYNAETLKVTASVGVTFCDPTNSLSLEQLFEQADQQLYRAKSEGRNRCCVFNADTKPQESTTNLDSTAPDFVDYVNR